MQYLRKNTAVIVSVGPFLDKTDGVTLETALTITNERITLVAETDDGSAPTNVLDNVTGATSGTANDLNYITGNDAGMMQLELAAADVNRLGRMRLTITDAANHCPVFHEYTVLPADIYDQMFTANANRGIVIAEGTIGSTGNSTTALHLTGLTYGDAEINDLKIVILDVSTGERHSRWIDDWADMGDLATVATLPFTPENAVDTYVILAERRDVTLANGKQHGGTTATMLLERMVIASSTSNEPAIKLTGNGTAAGLQSTGGATGAGIQGTGGATSGAGLVAAAAAGNSDGATFTPAGTGLGMNYTNTVAGRIKKNTAFTNFMIKMELAADGTPGTGLTVTVQRAIDGGAFAALAVTTVTEISAGWYKFNLAAADVNGDAIAIKATATGAKQLDLLILTQVAG